MSIYITNPTKSQTGIDLKFFNTGYGFKNIKPGWHLIHFTNSDLKSLSSIWINVVSNYIYLLNEELYIIDDQGKVVNSDIKKDLIADWISAIPIQLLINFQSLPEDSWEELTTHISTTLLNNVMDLQYGLYTNTVSTLDPITVLKLSDLQNTIRPNATIQEISIDSLDKSWFIKRLRKDADIIGEFQLCFIFVVVVNNYCILEQWITLIKLVLMSHDYIESDVDFTINFLRLFNLMIDTVPVELVIDGLVDFSDKLFLQILKRFQILVFYDLKIDGVKLLQKLVLKLFDKFRLKFNILLSLDEEVEDEE